MHGVGGWAVDRALKDTGHRWNIVPEQAEPDGEFPTTQFPNPEEPGALDCAIKVAEDVGADAILANDPDADRLAVAIPNKTGQWTRLTGDQVGLIFAYHLGTIQALHSDTLFANTIVSSSQLKQIADDFGIQYASTLTGFKWLANVGLRHLELLGNLVTWIRRGSRLLDWRLGPRQGWCISTFVNGRHIVILPRERTNTVGYTRRDSHPIWTWLFHSALH